MAPLSCATAFVVKTLPTLLTPAPQTKLRRTLRPTSSARNAQCIIPTRPSNLTTKPNAICPSRNHPILLSVPTQENLKGEQPPFWTAAMAEALAGALAILLAAVTNIPILGPNFNISPTNIIHALVVTIPFSLAFWALEKAPTGITAATESQFRYFFLGRNPAHVALFCACVAFGEEFLFRGFLLAALTTFGMQDLVALSVSALVFGVLHAYTKVYMLLATIAGILFGAMFLTTRSILAPVIVHFIYDFCTILVMQRRWVRAADKL